MKRLNRKRSHPGKPLLLAGLTILATAALADGGGTYSVYDSNRDGYLDRQEFKPFAERKNRAGEASDLWQFDSVDKNGDERISEQEMVDALIQSLKAKKQ